MTVKKLPLLVAAATMTIVVVGVIVSIRYGGELGMTVRDITPEEAMRRIRANEKIILLDVRTPAEHAEKRIPASILLPIEPVNEVTAKVEQVIIDKRATVFVYCRSGRRSRNAVEAMQKLGYRNVYNLGGINDWKYETESPAK